MRLSSLSRIFALSSLLSTSSALAQTLACLSENPLPQDVDAWRLQAATALDTGALPDADVAQRIAQCFPTQVPQCLKRTNDYARRRDVASASRDLAVATSPQKQPPSELLSPGATDFQYVFPDNIEQLAAERGWPAVRYKSRHAGGFDPGTPSLLMVYVPGDRVNPPVDYDRWLNFALPADTGAQALMPLPQASVPTAADYAAEAAGGPSLPRIFTLVTVDRRVGLEPAKVYFQKFRRSGSGNPIFTPESVSNVASCIGCHPNGLRAISPLGFHVREGEEPMPETVWRTTQLINDAMMTAVGNRAVNWREAVVDPTTGEAKPLINTKSHGPIVGLAHPLNGGYTRTREFILGGTLDGQTFTGCYNRRPTVDVRDIFGREPGQGNVYRLSTQPNINWQNVAASMKCAACHNDSGRGALNALTDWEQIDFKILVDQSMPLGAHTNPLDQDPPGPVVDDLTADERIALTNCLQAEYEIEQTHLVKWLTQGACQ